MTVPFRDLRASTLTYNPVAGPNYGQANNYLNQATQAAGGIRIGNVAMPKQLGSIAAQNPNQTYSALDAALKQAQTPENAELRGLAMNQIRGLNTAPNRAELAARALSLQRERTAPQWQADLRTAGQQAAAMGRLGAGMTTTELNDITLAREKNLNQFGEQAAIEAAGQEMADRLARVGVTTGYEGQLTAEDLARAGFSRDTALSRFGVGSTVRGQNVDERNFQYGQGMDRSQLSLAIQKAQADAAAARAGVYSGAAGTSAGMAGTSAGFRADQAARAYGAGVQQQGFQADQAQQAIQNRAQQQLLQEQLLQGSFNRQLAGANAAGGYGFANDPYQTMLYAGSGMGTQAAGQRSAAEQAMAAAAALRGYM